MASACFLTTETQQKPGWQNPNLTRFKFSRVAVTLVACDPQCKDNCDSLCIGVPLRTVETLLVLKICKVLSVPPHLAPTQDFLVLPW